MGGAQAHESQVWNTAEIEREREREWGGGGGQGVGSRRKRECYLYLAGSSSFLQASSRGMSCAGSWHCLVAKQPGLFPTSCLFGLG